MRKSGFFLLIALLCSSGIIWSAPTPIKPLRSLATGHGDISAVAATELPDWITKPEEVPAGLEGFFNCTFSIASNTFFEEDGTCWERRGPEGFFREQIKRLHVSSLPACAGGPGHLEAIRICRLPLEETPCGITGPNACALCVRNPTCDGTRTVDDATTIPRSTWTTFYSKSSRSWAERRRYHP